MNPSAAATAGSDTITAQLDGVLDRLRTTGPDEQGLRVALVLVHEVLRQRQLLDQPTRRPGLEPPAIASTADPNTGYPQLVESIHRIVTRVVPAGAHILVISRGDDELLVPGYAASHFPSAPGGVYAGHYPSDGPAARAHLDDCRTAGAEYLVVPATAFWWLDYYAGLVQHLLARGRVVHHDGDCLVVRLNPPAEGDVA